MTTNTLKISELRQLIISRPYLSIYSNITLGNKAVVQVEIDRKSFLESTFDLLPDCEDIEFSEDIEVTFTRIGNNIYLTTK